MIFDCDGVLVDSERLAVDVDVAAITAAGWAITREEVIERFVGKSEADAIAEIERVLGRALPPGWDEAWAQDYQRVFDELLEPVPGVSDAVRELQRLGYRMCVASSGSPAKIERSLRRTGLWAAFDGSVFSALQVSRGKPAPDLFRYAAAQLGVPARRCVVVEDSQYGVAAARAAQMPVIGFAGGITPAHQLAGASQVIVDMADLVDTVGRLLGPDGGGGDGDGDGAENDVAGVR